MSNKKRIKVEFNGSSEFNQFADLAKKLFFAPKLKVDNREEPDR